jgi:hypothetical protein
MDITNYNEILMKIMKGMLLHCSDCTVCVEQQSWPLER